MNTYACNPTFGTTFHPNRLFRLAESLLNEARTATPSWTPAAEVSETDAAYTVKLDLPEVNAADVKVTLRDHVLSIKGERKAAPVVANTAKPAEKVHLQERTYGTFQRNFSLPKNADPNKVSADYKQGVLTVTILKCEEVQPKEIEVQVS